MEISVCLQVCVLCAWGSLEASTQTAWACVLAWLCACSVRAPLRSPAPSPRSGGFLADTARARAHTHTSVYLGMYMTAFTHIWTRFVLHASPGTQLPAAPLQTVPCCPGRSMCHQSVPDSRPSHAPPPPQAVNNSQTSRLLSQLGSFLTGSWPEGPARGSPGGGQEPAELLAVVSVTAAPGSWWPSRTRDITWGDGLSEQPWESCQNWTQRPGRQG